MAFREALLGRAVCLSNAQGKVLGDKSGDFCFEWNIVGNPCGPGGEDAFALGFFVLDEFWSLPQRKKYRGARARGRISRV